MGGFRAGSAGVAAAAVTAVGVSGLVTGLVIGLAGPSYADDTVTVQGTAFPDPARANLSLVGCADLYQRSDELLAPTIGHGPGATPSGSRSLGWDLAGGNAVGAQFAVASMATTSTASLAVNAADRATGVAYAGYQDPADAHTKLLWLGRSELASPGGAWQTFDAATRVYTWAQYDMSTGAQVDHGPGTPTTVAGFAATHGGDGPGIYTIGFGCNGTPFSMDRLRVGTPGDVTTYDVEGLQTQVSISREPVGAGRDQVTITGQLSTTTGDPIPHATMILERRVPHGQLWTPVLVAEVRKDGVRATVPFEEGVSYRWRFVERPLAEGTTSVALMLGSLTTPPTASPSSTPSGTPSTPSTPATPATPSVPSPPSPPDSPSGPSSSSATAPTDSASASASESTSVSASSSASSSVASPTDATDESGSPSESDSPGTR